MVPVSHRSVEIARGTPFELAASEHSLLPERSAAQDLDRPIRSLREMAEILRIAREDPVATDRNRHECCIDGIRRSCTPQKNPDLTTHRLVD